MLADEHRGGAGTIGQLRADQFIHLSERFTSALRAGFAFGTRLILFVPERVLVGNRLQQRALHHDFPEIRIELTHVWLAGRTDPSYTHAYRHFA